MFTSSGLFVMLCLWLAGLGTLELAELVAGRARRRRTLLERHGLALLLGLAVLPAIYVVLAVPADGPLAHSTGRAVAWVPAVLGLVLYLAGAARRWRSGATRLELADTAATWRSTARSKGRLLVVGGGVGLVLFFTAFSLFYAGSLPVHLFDSLYHFAYKGKVLFAEGFHGSAWMIPSPELQLGRGPDGADAVGRVMTHPNYPPGIPALHCIVGSYLGRFSEDATRPLMALYVVGCAALLWTWLSRRSVHAALVATLSWVSLPFLYYSKTWYEFVDVPAGAGEANYFSSWEIHPENLFKSLVASWIGRRSELTERAAMPDGWTLDGSADLPQAVMFSVGLILAWRCLRWSRLHSDRADAICAGLVLGGATLVKNEGLALLAVSMVVLSGFWLLDRRRAARGEEPNDASPRRNRLVDGALTLGIAVAVAAPWLSIRGEIPSIDEDYPAAIKIMLGLAEAPKDTPAEQPRSIGDGLARVPIVLAGFGTTFVNVLRWNLVWVLFLATVGTWLVLRTRRLLAHPHAPLLLATVLVFGAYGLILVVTPWDLPLLFSTAIPDRIVLHAVPLVLFVTAALLWRRPEEWDGPAARTGPGAEPVAEPSEEALG